MGLSASLQPLQALDATRSLLIAVGAVEDNAKVK